MVAVPLWLLTRASPVGRCAAVIAGTSALVVVTVKVNGLPVVAVAEAGLVITGEVAAPAGSAPTSIKVTVVPIHPVAVKAATARTAARRRRVPGFTGTPPSLRFASVDF